MSKFSTLLSIIDKNCTLQAFMIKARRTAESAGVQFNAFEAVLAHSPELNAEIVKKALGDSETFLSSTFFDTYKFLMRQQETGFDFEDYQKNLPEFELGETLETYIARILHPLTSKQRNAVRTQAMRLYLEHYYLIKTQEHKAFADKMFSLTISRFDDYREIEQYYADLVELYEIYTKK